MMRLLTAGPLLVLAVALAAGCADSATGEELPTAQGAGTSPSPSASVDKADQARKFAACMRENGMPNFPDPDANGEFDISGLAGGGGDRGKVRAALEKCQDLRPPGLGPDAAQANPEQLLKWAQCMRDKGVDVPDPNPNGGPLFEQGAIDFDDPAFRKAMEACRDELGAIREGAGG